MDGLTYKGIPLGQDFDDAALEGGSLNVAAGDLATPVATLSLPAMESNAAAMRDYCSRHGMRLAPHAKTTLAAGLLALQVRHGAWALTAALPRQVALLWDQGFSRVLLANEVTDPAAIEWLARRLAEDDDLALWVYIDSERGIDLLREGMHRVGSQSRPFDVLVELGHPGGRTGCRTVGEATGLAERVARTAGLRLAGVAGYEGTLGAVREPRVVAAVDHFLGELRESADTLLGRGLIATDDPVISAGGSLFFDRVVAVLGQWAAQSHVGVVLRSGCYLIHDHGLYAAATPASDGVPGAPQLTAALSVWARVVSVPESGLALADAGRRDVSHDAGLPVPLQRFRESNVLDLQAAGAWVDALSDQHAYVRSPAGLDVRPGDLIRFGISHPCTTIDRHRALFLVDGNDRVRGAVRTNF